jgi:CheY-like chemotaxis protein
MNAQKTILLVDDDHDTLDFLEIILSGTYTIITALNGFDALTKANESTPDLIMTDIMMPVMNGINFINNLRKNSLTSNIPVVAITSFVESNPVKSLLNLGFKDVIGKPFIREDILRVAQTVLGKSS